MKNKLALVECNKYMGLDVSKTVINICKKNLKEIKQKVFYIQS